jgi:hypothetical protein
MACLHNLSIVLASPTVCQPTESKPKRPPALSETRIVEGALTDYTGSHADSIR